MNCYYCSTELTFESESELDFSEANSNPSYDKVTLLDCQNCGSMVETYRKRV